MGVHGLVAVFFDQFVALDAVDDVAFVKQEFGLAGAVLAGDADEQCGFCHWGFVWVVNRAFWRVDVRVFVLRLFAVSCCSSSARMALSSACRSINSCSFRAM